MERIDYEKMAVGLREDLDEYRLECEPDLPIRWVRSIATTAAEQQREAIALAYERTGTVAIPNAIREIPLITDNESEAKDAD